VKAGKLLRAKKELKKAIGIFIDLLKQMYEIRPETILLGKDMSMLVVLIRKVEQEINIKQLSSKSNVGFTTSQGKEKTQNKYGDELDKNKKQFGTCINEKAKLSVELSVDENEIETPMSKIIPDNSKPKRNEMAKSSIDVLNELSESWIQKRSDNSDINHKYIIIIDVLLLLKAKEGEKILDFVCGDGTLSRMLSNIGATVTGIEPSDIIDYAVEMERENLAKIQYIKNDSLEEFEDKYFDKIVCNMALMEIEKVEGIFKEFYRILKPGGRLVFSVLIPFFNESEFQAIKFSLDSKRDKNKVFVVKNYFDDIITKYRKFGGVTQCFLRERSQYVKLCRANKFIIDEILEPLGLNVDNIESSLRDLNVKFDRTAKFMVFSLRKELFK